MAVKVSHDDPIFCGGLNEVGSDGFVRWGWGGEGVDVENLQVVVWQVKFYSKKFCITCSGSLDDNSILAPAF